MVIISVFEERVRRRNREMRKDILKSALAAMGAAIFFALVAASELLVGTPSTQNACA